ncbi:MAG: MobA/MobL family protein [Luteibacter sp.]|uniref:MobA/MobL family protein n=1 Tax=Luteibacter sp. TaxID=1886636 RepID=UPI0028089DA4|nr:MobA/MobL family protein [Luteibacter sp.]MDQ7996908.1 MobA/MobL family protein [Luteibacter sp.]MDQ8049279.1 MobA/MobL family protein [Luteibacter sp.]
MSLHARPHLETHRRSSGHSAVAGVAYRLGLRLFDRRTGIWHDYRKRKIGEEIVRALTVAPDGAPEWATDPDELWNRCEAAERRKDSQVARDYRIPIPFGLTDEMAGDMAEQMARLISRQLHTVVSLGLHRDSHIDALGAEKPGEKIGFHAHLYFPTRRLEEIVGEDGTSEWGPGAKLVLLSNKNTAGAFVEQLNERWAELANNYTTAVGLTADYDHRSYVRQDIPITPQTTLGAAVTAMERRGFFTRRGDALRGDIMVPSLVYEAAHAVDLADQRARAADDAVREAMAWVLPAPQVMPSAADQPDVATVTGATVAGPAAPEHAPDPHPVPPEAPPPLGPRPAGWERSDMRSFTSRLMQMVPPAAAVEEEAVRSRLEKLVRAVERALSGLVILARKLRGLVEDRERRMSAKLDTDYQLDGARQSRAAAEGRVRAWEAGHPWQMKAARAMLGADGRPKEWSQLHDQLGIADGHVQRLKSAVRRHQSALDDVSGEIALTTAEQGRQIAALGEAVGSFVAIRSDLAPQLVSAAYDDERQWLEPALNLVIPTVEPKLSAPVEFERLEYKAPTRRLSP